MIYDYLIVGAGLSGCVLAHELKKAGKRVLVIDKRKAVGGNCYTEKVKGIMVHKYGAHIFNTNSKEIWDYVNQFDEFRQFTNSPIAMFKGEAYNLPINMNTLHQLYGVNSIEDARKAIENDRERVEDVKTLEQYALSEVGRSAYETLIKGYTEKQWGKKCNELPKSILKRIPVRYTWDNNYYDKKYQGIPEHGYTYVCDRMLTGVHIELNCDFCDNAYKFIGKAKKVIYTGSIDALYHYEYGELEYRGLNFIEKVYDVNDKQGVAVMNYTDREVPYTRTIEHKHFAGGDDLGWTIVTEEYPSEWRIGDEPYYPIENNRKLYNKYKKKAEEDGIVLCGRLAEYKYYDMQDAIKSALELSRRLLNE